MGYVKIFSFLKKHWKWFAVLVICLCMCIIMLIASIASQVQSDPVGTGFTLLSAGCLSPDGGELRYAACLAETQLDQVTTDLDAKSDAIKSRDEEN